jgi:2-keto-4-pentenoate hydratase/2-oxohepta-3-ene-1,7-dioic acid hydratase in catechol pathway
MQLCNAYHESGPRIGLGQGDQWFNLSAYLARHVDDFPWMYAHPRPTMLDLLENHPNLLADASGWLEEMRSKTGSRAFAWPAPGRLLAPIGRPTKIVALGRNYAAHAQESGNEVPQEPVLFAKAPSAVCGPGDDILYPAGVKRLDPEIELAVVIGRRARRVEEAEAMTFVAGYTILNDITARDVQRSHQEKKWPWFRSKSYDTFCPMGPTLVLPDEVTDPHNLNLTLSVNGEIRQRSNTGMMIFKIPLLIATISSYMTLEPGDVIATGTPEGIAPLNVGNLVECFIEGLGTLQNRVVSG